MAAIEGLLVSITLTAVTTSTPRSMCVNTYTSMDVVEGKLADLGGERPSQSGLSRSSSIIIAIATATTTAIATHSPLPTLALQRPLPAQSCSRQRDKAWHWRCAVRQAPAPAPTGDETDMVATAKPMTALQPFRVANAAFISTTAPKDAAPMQQRPALVKGGPPPPGSMKEVMHKLPTEVPLPSQEGTKGVMQYALYVGHTQIKRVRGIIG